MLLCTLSKLERKHIAGMLCSLQCSWIQLLRMISASSKKRRAQKQQYVSDEEDDAMVRKKQKDSPQPKPLLCPCITSVQSIPLRD